MERERDNGMTQTDGEKGTRMWTLVRKNEKSKKGPKTKEDR